MMSSDRLDLRIIETRTVAAQSVLGVPHTVRIMQEYEVEAGLCGQRFIAWRRYREFRKLHSQVKAIQLLKVSRTPLPEFPKKATLHSLSKPVVDCRRTSLETYIRTVSSDSLLLPFLLNFLSIPFETLTSHASESISLKESELLILELQRKLKRDPGNKVNALSEFYVKFFAEKDVICQTFASALIGELLPICGDPLCGSVAMEILSKSISAAATRSAHVVQSALSHCDLEVLARMRFDAHILGKIHGDSVAAAFSVLSFLHDELLNSGRHRQFAVVLNRNSAALETFINWTNGTLVDAPKSEESREWISKSFPDFPELHIEHRCGTNDLEVRVFLSTVHATRQRLAECITQPELRHYWDRYVLSGRTVKVIDANSRIIELLYNSQTFTYTARAHCFIEVLANGDIEITFHLLRDDNIGPFLSSYLLEGVCQVVDSESSSDSSIDDLITGYNSPVDTQVTYKSKLVGDLRKIRMEDFAEGCEFTKTNWQRLKQFAETDHSTSDISEETNSLHAACESKKLS